MRAVFFFSKNWLLFVLLSFFWSGCSNDKSKKKLSSTVMICNKILFVESFTIFGSGAYGGDRVSDYLTDSTGFRMYVGTYDNGDEGYSYKCNDDNIIIYKVIGRKENKNKIADTRVFSLSELRAKRVFE
jgi:hypothetical protein